MNNLKILLLSKGYKSIAKFVKDKHLNYQNFLNLFKKKEVTIKDLIEISELLEITFMQSVEFFLPDDYKKIIEINEKYK